jgi:hypothetical protein
MSSLNDRLLPFQHKNSTRKHPASTSGKLLRTLSEFPFYELSDLKIKIIGWMGEWKRGPTHLLSVEYKYKQYSPAGHFLNYITTGAFTLVGHLLAPVVKQYFQMSWAPFDHLIVKNQTCWKSCMVLHLPAFSNPLTFSTLSWSLCTRNCVRKGQSLRLSPSSPGRGEEGRGGGGAMQGIPFYY